MMFNGNVQLLIFALAIIFAAPVLAYRCLGASPSSGGADTGQYYPYLTANGLYGYVDKNLNTVIAPVYRSAAPFTHTGFAVVENEQMSYGVIDTTGTLVVPFRYNSVSLEVIGNHTLVRTERGYTVRSRFWDWRFLPGFSVIGGSSDSRLFDTKVKRSQVKIILLESGQVIYSARMAAESSFGYHADLRALDDTRFLLKEKLFRITDRKAKLLARNIYGRTDGPYLLQQRGNTYRLIDPDGTGVSSKRYKWADSLHTSIAGSPFSIPVTSNMYGEECHATVFVDGDGFQYLFPDFTKAFPSRVDPVTAHGFHADTVLNVARLIRGMPGTDRFILRRFNKKESWFEYPMVDTAGHWHMEPPPNNTFTATIPSGNILWPPAAHIIPKETIDAGWRVLAYSRVAGHLYAVTVGGEGAERMGLWDGQAKCWRWKPEHLYIRCLDFDQGYWTFKPDKDSPYGLYHLHTDQIVIPPRYHDMSANGMVTYHDQELGYVRFYVDWHTQQEYREKSK